MADDGLIALFHAVQVVEICMVLGNDGGGSERGKS